MKIQYPSYYPQFHCIASACKHTCCAGWEIDIDEATLARYKCMPEGEREGILSTISFDDIPHFALQGACERCPHLDDDGLCRIISQYGEAYTPDICRDHPRYRHILADGVEYGIGLACEEACRVVLATSECTLVVSPDGQEAFAYTEDEKELIDLRAAVTERLQMRHLSIAERFSLVCEQTGIIPDACTFETALAWFDTLEYQSREWRDGLAAMREKGSSLLFRDKANAVCLEQLAIYFINRHLLDALEDGYVEERIAFTLLSTYFVAQLAATLSGDMSDFDRICEAARIYSAEIEYSTENTDILFEKLGDILWG